MYPAPPDKACRLRPPAGPACKCQNIRCQLLCSKGGSRLARQTRPTHRQAKKRKQRHSLRLDLKHSLLVRSRPPLRSKRPEPTVANVSQTPSHLPPLEQPPMRRSQPALSRPERPLLDRVQQHLDRKSTRLNSSHGYISSAV